MSFAARFTRLALAALLIVPALAFFPRTENVFWMTESVTARFFAGLALALALWTWQDGMPGKQREARAGLALAAGLGLWLVLAAAFSLRRDLAFTKLWEYSCYPAAFVAAWQVSRNKKNQSLLLAAMLAAGFALAAYGLLQSQGIDFVDWNVTFGGRAASFLGNPDFLGGHLALLAPLCLAWAIQNSRSRRRKSAAALWIVFLVLLLGLLASATRSAILGCVAGCGLLAWLAARRFPGALASQKKWLIAGAVLLLAFLGLAIARQPRTFARLWSLGAADEAPSQRGSLLRSSLALAGRHPLLGVGPGHFPLYFPTVQAYGLSDAELAKRPYVFSSHSHNDIVQMAAEAGWPAALLLVGLYAWLYRRLARRVDDLKVAGLMSGLAALHLHGLFNFPFLILPTQITAWCMAALALRLSDMGQPKAGEETQPWRGSKALALAVLAAWVAGQFLLLKDPIVDRLLWAGKGEMGFKKADTADVALNKGISLRPGDDSFWYFKGLNDATRRYTINATASWKRCLELNPYSVEARWRLGKATLELSQPAEAEKILAPLEDYAANFWQLWEPLAASRYQQGKFAEALRTYDRAILLGSSPGTMYENRAACLGNLGRYEDALKSLDTALQYNSFSASAYLSEAVTFMKMGRWKEGKQALDKSLRLDPENDAAQQLKKHLPLLHHG